MPPPRPVPGAPPSDDLAELQRQVAAEPDRHELRHALGLALHGAGRPREAESQFERAIALRPDAARSHMNLGALRLARGDVAGAVAALRTARDLDGTRPAIHFNLGNALLALDDRAGAEGSYRRALELQPGHPGALNNLATLLLGRGDGAAAESLYREALRLRPDAPELRTGLGAAREAQGDNKGAMDAYRAAIAAGNATPGTHFNLGNVLRKQGRLVEAEGEFRHVLARDPDHLGAATNLGDVLTDLRRVDEGLHVLREAVSSRSSAVGAAESRLRAHSSLLMAMHYLPSITPEEIAAEHRRWDALHTPREVRRSPRAPHASGRLRIGYVSPDLRAHAVTHFFEPLLRNHDRRRVEVFAYAQVARPDEVTARLRGQVDAWRDITRLSDDEVVRQVDEDRIDVLVDVAGHTAQHRLGVFARRAAPIQVTYLGYPDTTGLRTMDYRITDAIADPPGTTEAWHSERLARLPGGAWCYLPPDDAPDPGAPPSSRRGWVTFGSFNNGLKVTREWVGVWSRLLTRVPDSRLLLKAKQFGVDAVRDALIAEFATWGIGAERLDLRGFVDGRENHLSVYREVDIGLDTFPYAGTTTTADALVMGVPVVTRVGVSHVSRVGASLLARVGLSHLAALGDDDYVERAAALAHDRTQIASIRARLRADMLASPLGDGRRIAREMEDAFEAMCRAAATVAGV